MNEPSAEANSELSCIEQYRRQQRWEHDNPNSPGIESDWIDFHIFEVSSGTVQIVDATYVPEDDLGYLVVLKPGEYRVQVKTLTYGYVTLAWRLRMFCNGIDVPTGELICELETESGVIGIRDLNEFQKAWGKDDEACWQVIDSSLQDVAQYGIVTLERPHPARMIVSRNLNNKVFLLHSLKKDDQLIGIEIIIQSSYMSRI